MSKEERTSKVLEKWGVDESMNQENIQKAAEMYAKIKVKNRFLKKVAFLGVIFMLAFLGLMLGSVILGTEISKEFKVKNEVLVQRSGNGNALETSEVFYSVKLNLLTPLSVIKGLKSLKFNNKNDGSIIQFNINSFYYIYGRNLTLYGTNYMANVLGNGNVEFYSISNKNGARSIDEKKVIKKSEDDDDLEAISTYGNNNGNGNGNGNGVVRIYDCEGLSNIGSTGKYALMNNINCTLSEPLLTGGFYGTINGRGNTITLNMNRNGPVALFTKLGNGAKIGNLFIGGSITGKGNCSAFALEAFVGSKFLSSAVYATITCGNINDDLDDYTNLGGFAAVLRNPTGATGYISFKFSVNQGFFNSISTNLNKTSYTGGFYGRMGNNEYMKRRFNFTYSATNYTRYGNESHVNRFGFKWVFAVPIVPTSSPSRNQYNLLQKRDPYIPEDCYNFDDTNLDFINMCIDWYVIYWFENYDCCFDFNSCPFVNCDHYSDVCTYCKYWGRNGEGVIDRNNARVLELIKPVPKNMCGFEQD